MTYKENAEKFIETYGLGIGDTVKINKEDISYTGILLDRPEDADDGYLVLKLSSGYNIGVAIENTTAELVEKGLVSKHKDKNGRSINIKTTPKFAEYFKLKGDTRALAQQLEKELEEKLNA